MIVVRKSIDLNGKGDNYNLKKISEKHNIPIDKIKKEYSMGIKIEFEHTKDPGVASQIAIDHLTESPVYYTELKKMESKMEKSLSEENKEAIKQFFSGKKKVKDSDFHSFVEERGIDPHIAEEYVYELVMQKAGKDKVAQVMREFKEGTLTSHGKPVTSRDQAIAIAMSEAGMSKANKDLDYWKKKLSAILSGEKMSKSIFLFPRMMKGKAYPIGTKRTWGGKTYKKVAGGPSGKGKWMRTYTGDESRGEKQAIRNVMKKIQGASSMEELAEIVSQNMSRFKDESGKTLSVVKEFMSAARGTKAGEKKNISSMLSSGFKPKKGATGGYMMLNPKTGESVKISKDEYNKASVESKESNRFKRIDKIIESGGKLKTAKREGETHYYITRPGKDMKKISKEEHDYAKGKIKETKKPSIDKEEKYPDLPKVERSFKVKGKGRKYLKISYPGRSKTYDLEMTEETKDLKSGDGISGIFAEEKTTTKYGTTVKYYLVSQEGADKIKKKSEDIKTAKELKRWTEYVENAADKGYVYNKGVDELRKLNYSQNPEIKDRVDKAIQKVKKDKAQNEADRWIGYIESNINQYWYRKGEIKANEYIRQLEKMGVNADEYKDRLEQLKEKFPKIKTEQTITEDKDAKIIKVAKGSGYGGFPYTKDTIIKAPERVSKDGGPQYLYVLEAEKKYYKYDGLLFGVGDDSGYIYSAKTRPATEKESEGMRAFDNEKSEHKKRLSLLNSIEKDIKNTGEVPKGMNRVQGEEFINTFNIYGGGSKYVVNDKDIWYVENHGMDGDAWSLNNVKTGGAGAIGWKIPYDKDTADKIRNISNDEKRYKEYLENTKGNESVFPVAFKKSRIVVRVR